MCLSGVLEWCEGSRRRRRRTAVGSSGQDRDSDKDKTRKDKTHYSPTAKETKTIPVMYFHFDWRASLHMQGLMVLLPVWSVLLTGTPALRSSRTTRSSPLLTARISTTEPSGPHHCTGAAWENTLQIISSTGRILHMHNDAACRNPFNNRYHESCSIIGF